MVNLSQIPSNDLKKILRLIRKKDEYEAQMAKIIQQAERKPSLAASLRQVCLPRKAQPSLREMIARILEKAGKPMSVAQIYEASLQSGYVWRSQQPLNALNVKMYTDPAFKKVSPGRFVLRAT